MGAASEFLRQEHCVITRCSINKIKIPCGNEKNSVTYMPTYFYLQEGVFRCAVNSLFPMTMEILETLM
jgi:hypothetical protein